MAIAKPATGRDVLYLSFDGMTDPLGRSQVLPYLAGLSRRGHRIRIVSLEKPIVYRKDCEAVAQICADAGLAWHPLRYRAWLPIASTLLNLRDLRRAAQRLHRVQPADFVHCRSDLPAIVGLALKRKLGLPLLYDMRAFWADERVESGWWDQSQWLYRKMFRYFKVRQRELLAEADEVVVLSEAGRKAVIEGGLRRAEQPITVIPCCADFDLFAPPIPEQRAAARAELGIATETPLVIHVGSIGSNCLLDEMLDFFAVYRRRRRDAQFLFVAPAGEEAIRAGASKRGLSSMVDVRSAGRDYVPRWIGAADLGIMFVRPVWSKRAASPTKLGEMLAVGLPVIANEGVGDVAEILAQSAGGIVVKTFDEPAYDAAMDALDDLKLSADEVRNAARRWFDLADGIALYDRIYRRSGGRSDAADRSNPTTRGA